MRWRKKVRRARQRERRIEMAVASIEATAKQRASQRPEIEARCSFLREYLGFFEQYGSANSSSQEALVRHRVELFDLEAELLLLPAA
jgi:hypothetical protein